jgi:hypothetical protein
LKDGDEGVLRYSIYFPSDQFERAVNVSTAYGQVLSGFNRGGKYDSFPMVAFETHRSPINGNLYAKLNSAQRFETEKVQEAEHNVGEMRFGLSNRWIDVEVAFGLSTGDDGYLTVTFDGTEYDTFNGPTALPGNFLEIRYGIYHTGTNQFIGGAEKIPTQVVYYSDVEILQKQ